MDKWPICLGALLLSACAVDTVSGPPAGVLVVDWTVSSTKDPAACDASGARDLDVTVRSGGGLVAEVASDCRNFSESITLGPGGYDAEAVLLDSDGNPRSTTISLGHVDLFAGDEVIIPINFPETSLL